MEEKIILSLVDAALKGDKQMAQMAVRKLASKARNGDPSLFGKLSEKLKISALRSSDLAARPLPVDSDSRQNLIRIENPIVLDKAPVHTEEIRESFKQVLLEREHFSALLSEGVFPTRSLIFQGPPGVGKTMSARWLAGQLGLPLLVLDLATVMSSFLGKTGSNVRSVLEHAMSFPCVLLLDEFDAIAKRRDDERELGELKRLVTVLLQAIDDWPSTSLLIAATNHGELLDPAIWRRFDTEIIFEMPSTDMIGKYINEYWPDSVSSKVETIKKFSGMSFSDIDRELKQEKRKNIIRNISIRALKGTKSSEYSDNVSNDEKKKLVIKLNNEGMSQRQIAIKLGISRPTVKKALEESSQT